jgi:hypothetical protein
VSGSDGTRIRQTDPVGLGTGTTLARLVSAMLHAVVHPGRSFWAAQPGGGGHTGSTAVPTEVPRITVGGRHDVVRAHRCRIEPPQRHAAFRSAGDGGGRTTAVVTAWTVALVGVIVWPMASRAGCCCSTGLPGPAPSPSVRCSTGRAALRSAHVPRDRHRADRTRGCGRMAAVRARPRCARRGRVAAGDRRRRGRGRGPLIGPATLARLAAATAAVWNPFVYDRVYAGHLNVLLGYALLPYLVHAAVAARSRLRAGWSAAVPTAAWWWAATAVTLHLFWVGLVLVCATTPPTPGTSRGPRCGGAAPSWWSPCSAPCCGWPSPAARCRWPATPTRGRRSLLAPTPTSVSPSPWRLRAASGAPRPATPARPASCGPSPPVRSGPWPRWAPFGPGAAAPGRPSPCWASPPGAGLLAAHGTAGPLGPVFGAALDHLPGFGVMREPGKFLALVSLAVAVASVRVSACSPNGPARQGRWIAAALLAVPLVGSAPLALGLDGRLTPSRFPASWTAARDAVDAGDGPALLLPVGTYVDPGFTGGRIVAEPAAGWFGDSSSSPTTRACRGSPPPTRSEQRRSSSSGPHHALAWHERSTTPASARSSP